MGGKKEVLVVGSKVKSYIKAKGGMNTSAAVIQALSDKVEEICDNAIRSAKNSGRKTVMDKDI
jgi:histone H3/H4